MWRLLLQFIIWLFLDKITAHSKSWLCDIIVCYFSLPYLLLLLVQGIFFLLFWVSWATGITLIIISTFKFPKCAYFVVTSFIHCNYENLQVTIIIPRENGLSQSWFISLLCMWVCSYWQGWNVVRNNQGRERWKWSGD